MENKKYEVGQLYKLPGDRKQVHVLVVTGAEPTEDQSKKPCIKYTYNYLDEPYDSHWIYDYEMRDEWENLDKKD